jgi:cyclopropane-fatty-acyl-phospholipid synthase
MSDLFFPRPTPARAARILREVFGGIQEDFAFRLWDGTEVRLGRAAPVATAVIKRPETFVKLMRDPSPGNFAEAYVASEIDLEGDLFATMAVANSVESMRLSPGRKLRLYLSMWRS